VAEFENPSDATTGPRAEGDCEAVARGAATHTLGARAEIEPTISARLQDGPLAGSSIEAEVVEGRPSKTLDVPADDGSTCRYCLAEWVQSGGRSAEYTFLYRV
jgi:hypothetical protein